MVGRRWQIVIGSALLVVMLMAASFALGVHVGEHGWTLDALRYDAQPALGQQPGPLAPGLPREPDVLGRIRSITAQTLQLATTAGPRLVELTDQTCVEEANGGLLSLSDLHPGDVVAVFGELAAGDGRRLLAVRILRLAANPPQP